jgi:hypothetical protein
VRFINYVNKTFNNNNLFVVGNEGRQRRGSVGSLDSGMSISFQSPSNNNNNNASNNKASETAAVAGATNAFVTTSHLAMAVSTVQQNVMIPTLLPNSALYQYNNEQMQMHMHELYEEHHHHHHHRAQQHAEASGRSTDV